MCSLIAKIDFIFMGVGKVFTTRTTVLLCYVSFAVVFTTRNSISLKDTHLSNEPEADGKN